MDTKEKKLNYQTDGVGSDLVRLFLMFMLISCIGWCMETVYVLLRFGHLSDRGFLSMPFCPIYGASILAVYFAVGTPQGDATLAGAIVTTVTYGVVNLI